ncbi:MAG: DMT family transporter [Candidatus Aenigmarchaeota archaeon]|nr:DMT family transporter [Candidatus Aenigmarchaeota archaeon]
MLWVVFAILATLLGSIINIIDKFVVTKWVREPIIPLGIMGFVGAFSSILIFVIRGVSPLSYLSIIMTLSTGVIYVLGTLFYLKALKLGEVSRIIPLFYLSPVFTLILAGLFLNEVFSVVKYIGIISIVIGAVLISIKKFERIKITKAFWLMILASLSYAIYGVLTRYLLNFADYWTIFGYSRIGGLLITVPIFALYYSELRYSVSKYGKKVVGLITTNETINIIAVFLITIAISLGTATLVNSLVSIQPLFVLIFAFAITKIHPQALQEEINKKAMIIKLISIILIVTGAYLIV